MHDNHANADDGDDDDDDDDDDHDDEGSADEDNEMSVQNAFPMPPQLQPIELRSSLKYETPFTATQKQINAILRDIPDSVLSA